MRLSYMMFPLMLPAAVVAKQAEQEEAIRLMELSRGLYELGKFEDANYILDKLYEYSDTPNMPLALRAKIETYELSLRFFILDRMQNSYYSMWRRSVYVPAPELGSLSMMKNQQLSRDVPLLNVDIIAFLWNRAIAKAAKIQDSQTADLYFADVYALNKLAQSMEALLFLCSQNKSFLNEKTAEPKALLQKELLRIESYSRYDSVLLQDKNKEDIKLPSAAVSAEADEYIQQCLSILEAVPDEDLPFYAAQVWILSEKLHIYQLSGYDFPGAHHRERLHHLALRVCKCEPPKRSTPIFMQLLFQTVYSAAHHLY